MTGGWRRKEREKIGLEKKFISDFNWEHFDSKREFEKKMEFDM